MAPNKRYKNIIFTIHEGIKNLGNVRDYLIENTQYLVTFHFPHGYLPKPCYAEVYKNGRLVLRKTFPVYRGRGNIVKVIIYYLYFQYVIIKYGRDNSFVIAENPVFCIFNGVFSLFNKNKFVYWVGDFYPANSKYMWLYNKVSDFYNKSLDYVIYFSPRCYDIYKQRIPQKRRQLRKVVSLGIKQKTRAKKTTKKNILGFIGTIRGLQGLDLIFKYLVSHDYKFEIIGSGYEIDYYKSLAKSLKIENKVTFYGFVDDPTEIFRKWAIGLAPYQNVATNVSIYCEPVKIKDYLSYGLPVITTNTTYIYEEIEKLNAGVIISENTKSLGRAIEKILKNYPMYRRGVDKLLEKYEYKSWYKKSFEFMES